MKIFFVMVLLSSSHIFDFSLAFRTRFLNKLSINSISVHSRFTTTKLHAKAKSNESIKHVTKVINIEDIDQDSWKLQPVIDILKAGGVGILCTDTCYSFVTRIDSQQGVERITKLKSTTTNDQRKPLTLLCQDIKMASHYSNWLNEKWVFKLMKATLPGPFTYIMPSSTHLPKTIVEHNKHVRRYKRKEIGIRICSDPICTAVIEELGCPLLAGSVPEAAEDTEGIKYPIFSDEQESSSSNKRGSGEEEEYQDDEYVEEEESEEQLIKKEFFTQNYMRDLGILPWYNKVDFIIENGPRGLEGAESLSTVVDLTRGSPFVVRQGKGVYDFASVSTTAA